jgi:hypothetical protein
LTGDGKPLLPGPTPIVEARLNKRRRSLTRIIVRRCERTVLLKEGNSLKEEGRFGLRICQGREVLRRYGLRYVILLGIDRRGGGLLLGDG